LYAYSPNSCLLVFNNFLKGENLEKLAEVDEFEVVKTLEEFYGDYYVATEHHFHTSISEVIGEQLNSWHPPSLLRCAESLAATLLALRRKPVIRYYRIYRFL
jgi:hypothetical protein